MSVPRSYWFHRLLAYPSYICWLIGTIGLWIPVTILFLDSGVFKSLTADWSIILLVLLSYAATSGLGFFVAIFSIGLFVGAIAARLNGAPHQIGEPVIVLSGPYAGRVATIYEISKGQGGQPVPRVDLGAEAKEKYHDVFDEYCLLRLPSQNTV